MAGPISLASFAEHLDMPRESLPEGLGGVPVNHLSVELLRRGHHLVVFTLDPSVQRELVLTGPRLKICVGPFRYRRARDFFRLERAALVAAMKRERPALIHAQWTYEFALAAITANLPHVVTAHDAPLTVLRHNFIPYRIARTTMAFRAIRNAQKLVAVSPHVATHLRRFFFPKQPIDVIPNGLPRTTFASSPGSGEQKGECLTFATVLNGFNALKNSQTALRAFALFRAVYRHNSRLLMFGSEHGVEEAAARWAQRHCLTENVEYVGYVPHDQLQQRLFRECDVLVHPSLEEAHPLAIIEAQAKGIPVIGGADTGGVPDVLARGDAGLLVDVRSARHIADAMSRLATDRALRQRLAARGFRLAKETFSIEAVATAFEHQYDEVLRGR